MIIIIIYNYVVTRIEHFMNNNDNLLIYVVQF